MSDFIYTPRNNKRFGELVLLIVHLQFYEVSEMVLVT